jgi:hypothetical protein
MYDLTVSFYVFKGLMQEILAWFTWLIYTDSYCSFTQLFNIFKRRHYILFAFSLLRNPYIYLHFYCGVFKLQI